MNVAIVPARGQSQRIPGKNIRDFMGRPIIAYSIDAALNSNLFDRIVVTSDDQQILKVARQCGAEAIEREMKMCFDDVGTQEVVADALVDLEVAAELAKLVPPKIDYVCCIYATAPMLKAMDLHTGFEAMRMTNEYAWVDGWFYWGKPEWFGYRPLEGLRMSIPQDRWIDINTEKDWQRAEEMYAALQKEVA